MQLAAKRVSAVVSGDYCQAYFDSDDRDGDQVDPYEEPEPYVMIQRQFESFDGGKCYIESHNEEYVGHFKLKLLEFSTTRLAYEISRRDHTLVEVTFALTAAEFEKALPIVEVIFGVREPGGDSQFFDQAF
jgi:hypothetical protein